MKFWRRMAQAGAAIFMSARVLALTGFGLGSAALRALLRSRSAMLASTIQMQSLASGESCRTVRQAGNRAGYAGRRMRQRLTEWFEMPAFAAQDAEKYSVLWRVDDNQKCCTALFGAL